MPRPSTGLVLTGGGARGAYQAGVLHGISKILEPLGKPQPFDAITGISAGAINAASVASRCSRFELGCRENAEMWNNLTVNQVFHTDLFRMSASGFRLVADTTLGLLRRHKLAHSLLDTKPLRKLLTRNISLEQIQANLNEGVLGALAITATNYTDSKSITFVQASPSRPVPMWERSRRYSRPEAIAVDHVMASAAIPIFFPPVMIGNDAFGDGCLRNTTPLSPAIHLGSKRLLVISVRRPDECAPPPRTDLDPSIARILGVMLNALFMDGIEIDMERMSRINRTLEFVPEPSIEEVMLKKVEYLWIRPSRDIGKLCEGLFNRLPPVLRYLVGGLGSSEESAELTSYLLFDPSFCGVLVQLGYEDAMSRAAEIRDFLS